jgi:regulator of sigma E protease
MIAIITFIVILSVLVFVHELGHYLVARRNGIRVDEFGMGLPPRVWGKQVGKTLYSINLLPIGGFVKLHGEDSEDPHALTESDSFAAQSPWVRTKVLVAGVAANFLLGILILTLLFRLGVPEFVANPYVREVLPDSPAESAGIREGDSIISVNGVELNDTNSLSSIIDSVDGNEVEILVHRGDESANFKIMPEEGKIGVVITNFRDVQYPWREAWVRGLDASVTVTSAMMQGLKDFLVNLVTTRSLADEVAGPVGIAQMTGEVVQFGYKSVLQFAGIISLNLALINILPFPALDGGRLFFVIVEVLTRRRVNQDVERWVHAAGMILLLLLLLAVTVQDVGRLFS